LASSTRRIISCTAISRRSSGQDTGSSNGTTRAIPRSAFARDEFAPNTAVHARKDYQSVACRLPCFAEPAVRSPVSISGALIAQCRSLFS
jgi:hypothetical protein